MADFAKKGGPTKCLSWFLDGYAGTLGRTSCMKGGQVSPLEPLGPSPG